MTKIVMVVIQNYLLRFGLALSVVVSVLQPVVAWAASPTPSPAPAATRPLSLTITPPIINLTSDPGKPVTTEIKVKQESGQTEQLVVGLEKFGADGETGKPQLLDRTAADTYFDWIKFDRTKITAPTGVWQTIHVTITTPKDAAFSYFYAVTFKRVGDDVRKPGQTSSIAGGTAVLILFEVRSPNAKRTLEVASFTTDHSVYEFLPATLRVKLANTGNVHTVPAGTIFITHGDKQIAALDLNKNFGNILPGTKRIYEASWTDGFPHYEDVMEGGKAKLDKNNKPVRHLVWKLDQLALFRMGQYNAHVLAVYDDGKRDVPVEAYVSFWVIPWRFLLVVFLVVALISAGIWFAVRGTWRGVRGLGRRRR